MASKKLFRLALSATAKIDTAPTAKNFIAQVNTQVILSNTPYKIAASSFLDDSGTTVAASKLPDINSNNGYRMLFWGGVLQHSAVYTFSTNGITFTFDDAQTIYATTPVTFTVVNFVPVATISIKG